MIFLFDDLKAVDINRRSPTIDIVTARTVNNTIVKNIILIMVPDNSFDLVGIVMFFLGYRYHYYSIIYFC